LESGTIIGQSRLPSREGRRESSQVRVLKRCAGDVRASGDGGAGERLVTARRDVSSARIKLPAPPAPIGPRCDRRRQGPVERSMRSSRRLTPSRCEASGARRQRRVAVQVRLHRECEAPRASREPADVQARTQPTTSGGSSDLVDRGRPAPGRCRPAATPDQGRPPLQFRGCSCLARRFVLRGPRPLESGRRAGDNPTFA
jgi:hypothetical protein